MRRSRVRVSPSAPAKAILFEVSVITTARPDTVVIPAAGKGTRLLPLTRAISKEMLPLGRKPILDHILEESLLAGIKNAFLILSREKLSIKDYFQNYENGLCPQYIIQEQQLGLGHAVLQSESAVNNRPFAVALGDSTIHSTETDQPFDRLLNHFTQSNADGIILVQRTPVSESGRYGIVSPKSGISEPFEITDLVEKPNMDQLISSLSADGEYTYAIAGRYAFKPAIFEYLHKVKPGAGGELQLTDAIRNMLHDGRRVFCTPLRPNELRRDIGTFKSYLEAFCAVALEDPEYGEYIRKTIRL